MSEKPARRVNVRLSVDLRIEDSGARLPAVSQNLSESGMLVRASRNLPRGTVVALEGKEFKAKGEVIWSRELEEAGTLLGIRFVSLGRRDRKFLEGLVAAGE